MSKELREEQLLALTDELREELEESGEDDSHPFLFAESAPNRFRTMTFFFPEEDGVRVEEDCDLNTVTAFYFDSEGKEEELAAGCALHQWAVALFDERW